MITDVDKEIALLNNKIASLMAGNITLGKHIIHIEEELHKVKSENKYLVRKAIGDEVGRLTKLRNDAAGVLKLLAEKGIVSNEELAEVFK